MTDKELLIIDLCCRMPYDTIVKMTPLTDNGWPHDLPLSEKVFARMGQYDVKPYLVPVYDMTDEQIQEATKILGNTKFKISEFGDIQSSKLINDDIAYLDIESIIAYIDWLNKNDFDYRGLIPKGLAIDKRKLKV